MRSLISWRVPDKVRPTPTRYLKRGESIPGFGHDLYPDGDPRGRLLLYLISTAYLASAVVTLVESLMEAISELLGDAPAIEAGMVTLAQALRLPTGAALALFALGRLIGWIGYAIEEYQGHRFIRPSARYVGSYPPL